MKIIQIGLGPIGLQVISYIVKREGLEVVAAVDKDPAKSGKKLGDICDFNVPDINIYATLSAALENVNPDITVITTVSKLSQIKPQIAEVAKYGLPIVSTCEELTHPWQSQPVLARQIDETCKENDISCLSTGVNPGFLMDYLPAVFTSVCQKVDHVKVLRKQNAAYRRGPFQQKIGVGLTANEFEQKKESIAHVGLPESTYMLAKALNWNLDDVRETINPVVAENDVSSEGVNIKKGLVLGVEQIAKGIVNDREVIELEFRASIGESDPQDTIDIKGTPSFQSVIPGGLNGDVATAAIAVNATRYVLKMQPGLKTMLDIPVAAYFGREAKVAAVNSSN